MPFAASLFNLCSFLAIALGGAELNWHLRSDFGPVPLVIVEDVISSTEIREIKQNLKGGRWGPVNEKWFPIKDLPRDPLSKAVQKIAAIDLQLLPDTIASRIVGVGYRINVGSVCDDAPFHFDNDEVNKNVVRGVDRMSSLLSSLTYLTKRGGPTIVLNYTEADYMLADTTPQGSGFLVMPRIGKHVTFDSRLWHGALSELRYVKKSGAGSKCESGEANALRVVLGMNYWDVRPGEVLHPNSHFWPTPGGEVTMGSDKLRVEVNGSLRVIPVRSDLIVPVDTKAAGTVTFAEACPGSWLDVSEGWSDGSEAWSGGSEGWADGSEGWSGDSEGWSDSSEGWSGSSEGWTGDSEGWTGDSEGWTGDSEGWAGDSEGWSDGAEGWSDDSEGWSDGAEGWSDGADVEQWFQIPILGMFKSSRLALSLFLRLPTDVKKQVQNRKQTLHFRTACEDVRVYYGPGRPHLHDRPQNDRARYEYVKHMVRNRCDIFGSQSRDIVPPTAAAFCAKLSGLPLASRSEL